MVFICYFYIFLSSFRIIMSLRSKKCKNFPFLNILFSTKHFPCTMVCPCTFQISNHSIAALPHRELTLPDYYLSHYDTDTSPHYHTSALSHCHNVTLPLYYSTHYLNITLSHCYTMRLSQCQTIIPSLCHTSTLSFHHAVTLLDNQIITDTVFITIIIN